MFWFFWVTIFKTVNPMLLEHYLSCLSVLWPNGWMDQDVTWYRDRPQPRPHCVQLAPSSPHTPERVTAAPLPRHFSAHVCCGQTAGCIRIPLCIEVGLDPGDIVLDGDPAPFPHRKGTAARQFSAHFALALSPISATVELLLGHSVV